jgi:hypothetical protein
MNLLAPVNLHGKHYIGFRAGNEALLEVVGHVNAMREPHRRYGTPP